jgi:hypothetical protein
MAKDNWNEYDTTASNNTVVADINIAEGCPPSSVNNALRAILAATADVVAGNVAINRLKVDSVDINGTTIGHVDDTDLLTLADGSLTVAGTVELGHASDTTLARASAGNLTVEGNELYRAGGTDVPVADGGTGRSTLTANAVLLGNGTSAVQMISPGADGQVLTSNGSTWQSEAASSGPSQATQSALEAETNEDTYAPPDLIKHSPGVAKAWLEWEQVGTHSILASYNITSVTDGGSSGDSDIVIATDFSSANYCITGTAGRGAAGDTPRNIAPGVADPTAGTLTITCGADDGSRVDCEFVSLAFFGDQ